MTRGNPLEKKKRSRHGLRLSKGNNSKNLTLKPTLKLEEVAFPAYDGYNSETTAESSNHSQSDSEYSGKSSDISCKNTAKGNSNYFYRGSKSPHNHSTVGNKLKKKIRKEKAEAEAALKAAIPESEKVFDSVPSVYTDQLAFIEAMKSMNLSIPSKSCELGGTFVHNSIRVNGRTESVYVMDMETLLDDVFPNNPPVISHVMC